MPSRRRAKSTQERPPSPPHTTPIARATRSHKSLSSQSQIISSDSLPPQRRSNRSRANDALATIASKTAGSRESPEDGGIARTAASKAMPAVDESRDDDDDDGDDGKDGDFVVDDIENKTPERVVLASSPHSSGEGHSSDGGGGGAVSSTSARKSRNSSARKTRRKKPRNPHIPPQKQRQLRKKQRERVQKRREAPYSPGATTDTPSGQPPKANNAFEEDFGPLLRGEVVIGDPQDEDQVDVSLVEATADFLLDAAVGGLSADKPDKEGQKVLGGTARKSLPTLSGSDALVQSPSRQPFLQEEKESRAAPSVADSNVASSPETVHEALEKPVSGQDAGGLFEEQRALGGRKQSLSPKDMRAVNTEHRSIKERGAIGQSPEGSMRLIVGDSPPSFVDENQEPAARAENGNNISPPTGEGSKASDITQGDAGIKAATVLLQLVNSGSGVPAADRKRSVSDMPLSCDDMTNPCLTCGVTLTKILKYQGRSLADLDMDPEVFMERHSTLCLRNLRDEFPSDAEDSDDQGTAAGDSDRNAGRDSEEHGPANGRGVSSVDGQEGHGGVDDVSSGNGETAGGRIVSLREENAQSPEAKRQAELRTRLQSLTYLTLPVGKTFEKEAEIRQEVIKSGRLPEGRTVGDLLNIPITPFSEFQATMDATKTDEEKFLVEEMIVESLHDMQMEYFMIDEAIRYIEAEVDTNESETGGSGEDRMTKVLSIHSPLEPEDSVVWEDKKEADLYGFPYDPSAMRRGNQNPTEQSGGKYSMRGRELRSRSKPIELPLYPGYEHDQRNQTLQTKLTRRRKLATEKEKGVETSTETSRADSVPPQPSVIVPKKRPGRPPKNPASVLQAASKDQTLPALLSHTGSADGHSVSPSPAESFVDSQNGANRLENGALAKCLHVRFSLARQEQLRGILSRQPNPLRVPNDSVGGSLVPSITQSTPVSPSQFYPSERQTGQGDSFLNFPSGVRSESPHGESAPESIMPKLEVPTKSGDKSRVRTRVRVRNRAPRRAADRQPATGNSALRIESSGTSISADQQESSKTTPGNSVVGYSTEADEVASDGGHSFHPHAFQSPKKSPGASPRRASGNPPAVMQFSSTPSPMYGVFSSRSPFPPGTSDLDPYRPRVRGKTYKTPTSITRTEAPPKTTTEEEFLAAQNGNLGKRKRVKTALAYEAPPLRRRGKADEDDGEEDIFSESSGEEPDEDDSGGYGKRRRKRR